MSEPRREPGSGVHEHVFDVWRAGYVAFCAICDMPKDGWDAFRPLDAAREGQDVDVERLAELLREHGYMPFKDYEAAARDILAEAQQREGAG